MLEVIFDDAQPGTSGCSRHATLVLVTLETRNELYRFDTREKKRIERYEQKIAAGGVETKRFADSTGAVKDV